MIATCTEFSVLIIARYLEERQAGLEPRRLSDQAARRTGRAFFTSAVTTIGGFAVLIGSALPLLRDFGIIVTLNVAVALLAALVVMPPLLVWADEKGHLDTGVVDAKKSVVLAIKPTGVRIATWLGAVAVVAAIAITLYATSERTSGEVSTLSYTAVALPTTTTTTTEPAQSGPVDPSTFGTERPTGLIDGVLYDKLTAQGAAPNQAVCAGSVVLDRVGEQKLLDLGIASFSPEALAPVVQAAQDCGIDQSIIDATVAAGL